MPTLLTAQCPKCKVNTLDVQVGRKSTCRLTHCRLCDSYYDYSAWVIKTTPGATFTEVELHEREVRR